MYCLSVIGYHNTHSIVSVSNDGKMCQWKPKVLADPREFNFLTIGKNLMQQDGQAAAQEAANPMAAGENK